MDDQLEKFWLIMFLVAFFVCAAIVAARGQSRAFEACYRDILSDECAIQLEQHRRLDELRFWIDQDARARTDEHLLELYAFPPPYKQWRHDDGLEQSR